MEVDKVLYHFIPNPIRTIVLSNEQNKIEEVMVDSKIYTDGEIIKIIEHSPITIDEYKIGDQNYDMKVDTLIKKQVCIKNASYIIVVIIAKEKVRVGKRGWGRLDVIKDSEIFLNNKKDKKALLKAEKTIMSISGSSHPKTVFEAVLGNYNQNNFGLAYKNINDNIYQLRK